MRITCGLPPPLLLSEIRLQRHLQSIAGANCLSGREVNTTSGSGAGLESWEFGGSQITGQGTLGRMGEWASKDGNGHAAK